MQLIELELTRFRNYRALHWRPGAAANLLLGANAQGKTNLLEAVSLLTRGRSKRVRTRTEIVTHGERDCRLAAEFIDSQGVRSSIAMSIDRTGARQVTLNGQRLERTSVLFETLPTVLQESADVEMLAGPPAGRRAFLDMLCLELSTRYVTAYGQHQKLLRSRNSLLARGRRGRELEVVTEQLSTASAKVTMARREATVELSREATSLDSEDPMERLTLSYDLQGERGKPAPEREAELAAWYRAQLEGRLDEDFRARTTGFGPHRDDLTIGLGSKPIRNIASRGQQRDVLVRLKIGEALAIWRRRGEMPLLLLDDAFSETDERRRRRMIDWLPVEAQLLLTGTDSRVARDFEGRACATFEVRKGEVKAASSE